MNSDPTLPADPAAEAGLLAACLMDGGETLADAREAGITSGSFYDQRNAAIYALACELHDKGTAPDAALVYEAAKAAGRLDAIGGLPHLSEVSGSAPTSALAARHRETVLDLARRRAAIRSAQVFIERARQPGDDWAEVAQATGQTLAAIGTPTASTWPDPVPFARPEPPPLDLDAAFPAALHPLREYVRATATALQVPPDAAALLAVGGLASLAASRAYELEPQPGWRETAPLWTGWIAQPGERKSALLAALSEPVRAWEQAERERLRPALAAYAETRRALESRIEAVRRERARCKTAEDAAPLADESDRLARELDEMPELHPPCLATADFTPEAVREALAANGEKLGIISAEIDAGKLMGSRYAKDGGANLDLFLSAWSGDAASALRIGKFIPLQRPALSMILAVQPAAVRSVLGDAFAQGRGMVDRFLFIQPPSGLGSRDLSPPAVPERLAAIWRNAVCHILAQPWPGRVELTPHGPARSECPPRIVRPDSEASATLLELRAKLEARMKPDADLHPLAGFASKLPGQVCRIALAMHTLATPTADTLTGPTMRAAVVWAPWLLDHARAVRGDAAEPESSREARRLLAAIKRHGRRSATARELHRLVQGEAVPSSEACADLISELVDRGYLRPLPPPSRTPGLAGRSPSPGFAVSPKLYENP